MKTIELNRDSEIGVRGLQQVLWPGQDGGGPIGYK